MADAKMTRSDQIISQLAGRANDAAVVEMGEIKRQVVVFRLSDNFFAFDGGGVKEIIPLVEMTPVPASPPHILGIINLRGEVEAVTDIRQFLGYDPKPPGKASRLVIAEVEEIRSGILVDSVIDVVNITESAIGDPASAVSDQLKGVVDGEFIYEGLTILLFDMKAIFSLLETGGKSE